MRVCRCELPTICDGSAVVYCMGCGEHGECGCGACDGAGQGSCPGCEFCGVEPEDPWQPEEAAR